MQTTMLKCKIHRARLMDLAGLLEYEQIQIYNVSNGERFTTYAIRGENDSGIISVNGAAAHKANVGDILIIAAYGQYDALELLNYKPRLVYSNPDNTVSHTTNVIPVQVA